MTAETPVPERSLDLPLSDDEHHQLYREVCEAIASLPIYFRTETNISGIMATDLHTLNSVLGASIEEQVVRTLNLVRNVWDPDEKYVMYSFVRQAQTFPDVLLRKAGTDEIILGIELKGWYLLAKEAEPSLRFQVTAAACSERDLLVVVPWVLGNVLSGSPVLYEPFVESARYAARFRNHHWQHVRQTRQDARIEIPDGVGPYPAKADQILDRPVYDGGGNFGRLARTGMMDAYLRKLNSIQLCGIESRFWRQFFKAFQEGAADTEARLALDRLRQRLRESRDFSSSRSATIAKILDQVRQLLDIPE